jgi:Prealbumin-like fold domain
MTERTPIHRGRVFLALSVAFALSLVLGLVPALASHPEVSLPGSDFEIDTDANLKQDDPSPSEDWVTIPQGTTTGTEIRKNDVPSGGTDDAFTGGAKEDTEVPTVSNGGIPPGKADLKTFAGYLETNDAGHRFLNLFWTRVQEPAGSTNVDFEFNKSEEISDNGVTPERTAGDVLIQYDLASGGTNVQLFLSRWITTGSNSQCAAQGGKVPCWGNAPGTAPRQNLTAAGIGTGSINTSPIFNDPATPAVDETDGLGPLSARTFGEAQIDFDAFTSGGGADPCVSFGSGFVKSRSSDSFTAELKDFIAPVALNLRTCGSIEITKTDDGSPATLLDGAVFELRPDVAPLGTAPGPEDVTVDSCTTGELAGDADAGVCSFDDVQQGNYWVVEVTAPAGHDLADPAFQLVTVVADETVEISFVNPAQLGAIQITKTAKHAADADGSIPLGGVTFTIEGGDLPDGGIDVVTDATTGVACLGDLAFATDYVVTESEPANYNAVGDGVQEVTVDNKAACLDDPYVGETLTFDNNPLTDITLSVDSLVIGGTASTIECDDPAETDGTKNGTTDAVTGDGSLTVNNLEPGTYDCTVVIDP